jgi:hypothetical protein
MKFAWVVETLARFGDIASIEVYGDDRAHLRMKSGEEHEVSGGSNDVNGTICIQDIELGDIDVEWRHISSIEFMQAPADIPPRANRLYGIVETSSGRFEGHVQWDKQECLATDILNANSDGVDLEIAMGSIREIDRHSGASCRVLLDDGRELLLDGTNDVDNGNRGIMVEDRRIGRVTIPWATFERLQFLEAPESGQGYDRFYGGGGHLRGNVIDLDGRSSFGDIVFDLDETKGWEMLNGSFREIEFEIPFMNVASIAPHGSNASQVILRSGETLELRDSHDVSHQNDGLLIVRDGDWENPLYLDWKRVARIEFESGHTQ